ncbi:hypothetical protein GNI_102550 [Gregarina niphandrodes]|uniref:Uncharacterized protein n=1 Tax=Gregarina niphandrodes TaxID=110365 RepID=A0A023B4C5_GRENI|nr:hypothetical protein GNI_102550 [Gregarina niphandrodes]EZG56638.1 hypothetical protein GNI_102550 [Gregarina niphandrodes]|eukprot:XP_011131218.1 hypothetical protein GNI_102550 [Gregarina niphandrodes]
MAPARSVPTTPIGHTTLSQRTRGPLTSSGLMTSPEFVCPCEIRNRSAFVFPPDCEVSDPESTSLSDEELEFLAYSEYDSSHFIPPERMRQPRGVVRPGRAGFAESSRERKPRRLGLSERRLREEGARPRAAQYYY